ncbi:hypothetical protein VTK26DRAFT_6686 [Humicola hyalothermophila]
MHASLLLLSGLIASAWAAPAFPQVVPEVVVPKSVQAISEYFNLLAGKVQESRQLGFAPTCDLSSVSLPAGASGLPPPSPGLTLRHIAIGRGTQNYTCANATAEPKATGAVATLFNATCVVATNPDLASALARAALYFPVAQIEAARRLSPSNLAVSGLHYFTQNPDSVPFFNLDVSPDWKLGEIPCSKAGSVPAPAGAARGLEGEPAVAWLKLEAKPGATGGLKEVYRVETVGGSPPATCDGMPQSFEVQYATQYWFYAK